MLKYFQRRKQKELYQQWVQNASLSPEAIPREEPDEARADGQKTSNLKILSIFLGISLIILVTGLVLLVVYSC